MFSKRQLNNRKQIAHIPLCLVSEFIQDYLIKRSIPGENHAKIIRPPAPVPQSQRSRKEKGFDVCFWRKNARRLEDQTHHRLCRALDSPTWLAGSPLGEGAGDWRATHGLVRKVMDLCAEEGIGRVTFIAISEAVTDKLRFHEKEYKELSTIRPRN